MENPTFHRISGSRGFALVITLVLMILIAVLAVGMLSPDPYYEYLFSQASIQQRALDVLPESNGLVDFRTGETEFQPLQLRTSNFSGEVKLAAPLLELFAEPFKKNPQATDKPPVPLLRMPLAREAVTFTYGILSSPVIDSEDPHDFP